MNKGALGDDELRHIARHSVANSKSLLDEAEVLFARERWARAAALAILAVEESGKAHLCHVWAFHVLPTVPDRTNPVAWRDFWDGFTDHSGKIDVWLSRVDGLGGCTETGAWEREAKTTHLSKLACLYVDFALPERSVSAPELVSEDDAQQFMDIAREALAHWQGVGWRADA